MERLRIKNFLIIEDADFEVGRFNIIIGSQASGKSIIAKLLYFFKEVIDKIYLVPTNRFDISIGGLLSSNLEKESLENLAIAYFKMLFPDNCWNNQNFKINYKIGNIDICLINNINLSINVSANLIEMQHKLAIMRKDSYKGENVFLSNILGVIENFKTGEINKSNKALFIPAGRSFFSILQNNIFFLLSNNIEIDQLLKEFGAKYESSKRSYQHIFDTELKQNQKIYDFSIKILKGKYLQDNSTDWIIDSKGDRVNLLNASSGQQEVLPMLIVLSASALFIRKNRKHQFFIEEPEAHLFPVSQKHIISLFSLIYTLGNDFVITTHSPYILTAINNAILAHDVITKKGRESINDLFDADCAIKYEDVRAYTIEDGKLISILNDETRLIGASIIDSVSDEFATVFDNLLDRLDA